jgi:hypothetical protein
MAVLPAPSPEERALISRIETRRMALSGDMASLRMRYEEIMRWANPPWDPVSRRVDPRPDQASAIRGGLPKTHVDLTGPALTRWAALQAGTPVILRVKPVYTPAPMQTENDEKENWRLRRQYQLDRAIAQNQSSQMENQTQEWMESTNFHRTWLWTCWGKAAFGKAILRSGWDTSENTPTVELMENPSQVYYGWNRRYGRRKLGWVIVLDQMSPAEADRRYGLEIPTDEKGWVDWSQWTGVMDESEMDQRPEQMEELRRFVYAEECWEMTDEGAQYALVVGRRVVDGPRTYPWKRLPFHVLEDEHIPTYQHGKSMAEVLISINAAYDDMIDRQQQVINFESGPRYKGLNFGTGGDEVDLPEPFNLVPLREGTDILQIDTRVDFWPVQIHAEELREAKYKATGLTPIAWGMSPNAQTSGRAMSAEWRAVELPLHSRLINAAPEIKDLFASWWDYAETYSTEHKKVAKGYRRFQIIWTPLDIRDKSEKTVDLVARLNNNMVDPETAIEESGYENVDEMVARIRIYMTDPVWNPLRYQQLLTLQQLELTIRQMQVQVQQQESQAQGGAPAPGGGPSLDQQAGDQAQQGAVAAGQAAQTGPSGAGPGQNQPGAIPMNSSILSRTPLVGGIGNQTIVPLGGPGAAGAVGPPGTAGNQPR